MFYSHMSEVGPSYTSKTLDLYGNFLIKFGEGLDAEEEKVMNAPGLDAGTNSEAKLHKMERQYYAFCALSYFGHSDFKFLH